MQKLNLTTYLPTQLSTRKNPRNSPKDKTKKIHEGKGKKESEKNDRRRTRTCNLLSVCGGEWLNLAYVGKDMPLFSTIGRLAQW
jgi:hypothetical protein